MLALAVLFQVAAGSTPPLPIPAQDQMPQITLTEALQRSARLDPNYVAALRDITDATWRRRSAQLAFIIPAISVQANATRYSDEIFNIGTGRPASQIVDARLDARLNLFRGGDKIFDLRRTGALLDAADANEVEARFQTALRTETDYYEVLARSQLVLVAQDRVRRAGEQLAVARARVVSGAAVQTDSLQLLLELTRARVDVLLEEASLRVARYELGRRTGFDGPVDAAPLGGLPARQLPITENEAVNEALGLSPRALSARADDRAAGAQLNSARSAYLPEVNLFGQWAGFDSGFFPSATTRTLFGIAVVWPLWNNAQREIQLSEAGSAAAVTRATLADTERGLRRDVVQAYETYNTARATADLAASAVVVALENLRVQEERYRSGATTIIDLISSQVSLTEAEAGLVQARHATLLALAGLEAILGRRLFPK